MEGARFLALLLYFEGRGAIAPLKRDALHNTKPINTPYHKYSGQDPQRLTCKKVPSPSSIRFAL